MLHRMLGILRMLPRMLGIVRMLPRMLGIVRILPRMPPPICNTEDIIAPSPVYMYAPPDSRSPKPRVIQKKVKHRADFLDLCAFSFAFKCIWWLPMF